MAPVGDIYCVAYRCQHEAASGRQLCRAHQRRLDQGGGLPTADELFPGDPSGHGVFGVVDRSDTGVLCHECGQRFNRVGPHLPRAHHIDVTTYRKRHGIPTAQSLAMPATLDGLPRQKPHPCNRCHTELTTPGKLCTTCGQQRKDELERRRNLPPEQPGWRPLTTHEKADLLKASEDELPSLIHGLQRDHVPSRAIGVVLGRTPFWMSRHHPRPERIKTR